MRLLLSLILIVAIAKAEILDDINGILAPYLQGWQDLYNSFLVWEENQCFAINIVRTASGITSWESVYYGLWDGFSNCEARDSNDSGIGMADSHNSLYQNMGRLGAFTRALLFFCEHFG